MVQLSVIDAQLTKLGVRKTWFCRPEIRELQHVLMDNEQLTRCVQGRYHGGFAILAATEQRLLLIDKKPLYLTVEDIRYDMISEVDISARLFDATVTIFTVNKQLVFSAVRQQKLREVTAYVQKRVMELRQYHPEAPAPDPITQQFSRATPIPIAPIQSNQSTQHHHHIFPSLDIHKVVGTVALRASRRNPNPYTKAPLMVRQQWSTWSPPISEETAIH